MMEFSDLTGIWRLDKQRARRPPPEMVGEDSRAHALALLEYTDSIVPQWDPMYRRQVEVIALA